MIAKSLAGAVRALLVALAFVALQSPASAQQPSANSIALAKEIIALKGSAHMFDSVVPNLVDKTKVMLLQTNPSLGKELDEVAAKLRTELAPRGSELLDQMAKLYAAAFTEQELKEITTFYKSPVGKKISLAEPRILEEAFNQVDVWNDKFAEEIIAKMRAEMRKRGHPI
jgi:uncharacterized protein